MMPAKKLTAILLVSSLGWVSTFSVNAQPDPLPAPPQDQGLPYTRSALASGRAVLELYRAAVFADTNYGSRYVYVYGKPVRLDDAQPLGGEPVLRDGVVYVPVAFASVLAGGKPSFKPAPDYLKERWFYSVPRADYAPSAAVRRLEVRGQSYVAVVDVAAAAGLHTWSHPRGLILVSDAVIPAGLEIPQIDTVVTLFDTPEKLADPAIATRSIPTLARQGLWSDHVINLTPEKLAKIAGPETEWTFTPVEAFDFTGFDPTLLGSAVPAPGVYPRLLFSPADVPALYRRLQSQKIGQRALVEWEVLFKKTWWDPKTSDGEIFDKLADPVAYKTLEWPATQASPGAGVSRSLFAGQKPGITSSHVNYNTNCLTGMALYCLLTGDEVHGAKAAAALANYFRLLEPLVDDHLATSDSEFGTSLDNANQGSTSWRGMHGVVAHMDLAFALDFGGKWMSAADKDFMRRFIAKATYGRRDNMQATPVRMRDINHMTWHLTNFLAVSAIEGLEGADPEVLAVGRESARAFCEWGIDASGQMYESNGKSGGGIQFQLLAMNVLARRGLNLWGHPHWRRLPEAQSQVTAPDGQATMSSGTWGGSRFASNPLVLFRGFYPANRAADYLLDQAFPKLLDQPIADYRAQLEKSLGRLRMPTPTYPAFVFTGLFDSDWSTTTRDEAKLPLDFHTADYGLLATRSDNTPQAAWLALHGRTNQYIGSGHHHADVGMIYFSALGVNWITERTDITYANSYDGRYHSEVLIDGLAQPDGVPARGTWLGASLAPSAAFAAVDQTRSYSYRWTNQITTWDARGNSVWERSSSAKNWELETDDPLTLAVYRGTQHWKSRPWWPTFNFSNWMPVLRAPYNPVQHAFRTAGLVRGSHPYGLVVDDVKKDDATRLYEWTAMPGPGVTSVKLPGLRSDEVVFVRSSDVENGAPRPGVPLLLIRALDIDGWAVASFDTQVVGPEDRKGAPTYFDRGRIALRDTEGRFRVLLLPLRAGESRPAVTYDAAAQSATIAWSGGQTDTLQFKAATDSARTSFTIERAGSKLLSSP